MVVFGDLAVIARPGAPDRRAEIAAAEHAVAAQGYRIARIDGAGHAGRRRRAPGRRRPSTSDGAGAPTTRASGSCAALLAPLGARRRRAADEGAAPEVGGDRAARRDRHRLRAAGR